MLPKCPVNQHQYRLEPAQVQLTKLGSRGLLWHLLLGSLTCNKVLITGTNWASIEVTISLWTGPVLVLWESEC